MKLNRLQKELIDLNQKLSGMNPAKSADAVESLVVTKSGLVQRIRDEADSNQEYKAQLLEVQYEMLPDAAKRTTDGEQIKKDIADLRAFARNRGAA